MMSDSQKISNSDSNKAQIRRIVPNIITSILVVSTAFSFISFNIFSAEIEKKIFEQLIQLNATILGFTIVGIFYYLGRSNDMRRDQINSLKELAISSNPINNETQRIKVKELLENAITSHRELFKKVMDGIQYYAVAITLHFGTIISLCFVPLLVSNEQKNLNTTILLVVIELILASVYHYIWFWRELKKVDESINKNIENYIKKLPDLS
jgi:hypothetical protein